MRISLYYIIIQLPTFQDPILRRVCSRTNVVELFRFPKLCLYVFAQVATYLHEQGGRRPALAAQLLATASQVLVGKNLHDAILHLHSVQREKTGVYLDRCCLYQSTGTRIRTFIR
jgi:hypothetical protein